MISYFRKPVSLFQVANFFEMRLLIEWSVIRESQFHENQMVPLFQVANFFEMRLLTEWSIIWESQFHKNGTVITIRWFHCFRRLISLKQNCCNVVPLLQISFYKKRWFSFKNFFYERHLWFQKPCLFKMSLFVFVFCKRLNCWKRLIILKGENLKEGWLLAF